MYKCEQCGKNTQPHEKMNKSVTARRSVQYKNGSTGWEIVKEISVCRDCKEK